MLLTSIGVAVFGLIALVVCLACSALLTCSEAHFWERIANAFRSESVRLARERFLTHHAGERIGWTRRIRGETHDVVGIYYGGSRPPRLVFYAVDRTTRQVHRVRDDQAYRPRVWR